MPGSPSSSSYEFSDRVAELVAQAPPLSSERQARITALFRAGAASDAA